LTYADIDRYLIEGKADLEIARRIGLRHQQSEHKRERPPIAPVEDLVEDPKKR
jgi:hypothetical protein